MKTKELIEELRGGPDDFGYTMDLAAARLEAILAAWEAYEAQKVFSTETEPYLALQHAITGD